jgi:ABC-type nitrate/sulfonate/bicarbonate transport system substrate-binding protein
MAHYEGCAPTLKSVFYCILQITFNSNLVISRTLYIYMDSDPFATTNNPIANFVPTFESYLKLQLKSTVPDQNLSFKLLHYDGTVSLDDLVARNGIDFYFGGPNTAACLISTYFATPVVTARKMNPGGGVINGYGGVIVVRSDSNINKVEDLKGSVIGVQQQNGWASNILQQGILTRSGINIFRDALQVPA